MTKSDLDLVSAIREAERRGEDVIAAGEAQQKLQRQQRATELQVPALGGGGQVSAAFPDVYGPSSRSGEEESSDRGRNAHRGRGGGVKGGGRGRGGGRGKGIKGVSKGTSRRSAGSRAR